MDLLLNFFENELEREEIYINNAKETLITSNEIVEKILNNENDFIKYENENLSFLKEYYIFNKNLDKDFDYMKNKIKNLKQNIIILQNDR